MSTRKELSIIRKIADYVLLNAYSTKASGLYNGKAGMALAMFEVSRALHDEYYEEQAMELLQESLLSQTDDIGYDNGLSGIGFVLCHLIEQGFVEANFEELFGSQLIKIKSQMSQMLDKKEKWADTLNRIKIIRFLDTVYSKTKDEETKTIAESLVELASRVICKNLSSGNRQIALATMPLLCTYMALLAECNLIFTKSVEVMEMFYNGHDTILPASVFLINYNASILADKLGNCEWRKFADKNAKIAMRNLYPETLSFMQHLELLGTLNLYPEMYYKERQKLEQHLFNICNENTLEHILLREVGIPGYVASYKSGLSGYLTYWSVKQNINYRKNLLM